MKNGFLLLAALLWVTGCSEKKPEVKQGPTRDEQGWPLALFYGRLNKSEAELRHLATDGTAPGYNLLAQNVIRKHYEQIGPTAHGAAKGTDVFWVPEKNVFFLRSDCDGHHVDGYIGPFDGDPRELLQPPSAREAEAQASAAKSADANQ